MNAVLKNKVINLRRNGLTYSEIIKKIGRPMSKSTLSNWCKGIVLPPSYFEKAERISTSSRLKAAKALKIKREKERALFLRSVRKLSYKLIRKFDSDLDIKRLTLAMLYLGEGAKWPGHRGLMLGNANPIVVKLYVDLLNDVYGISKNKLRARISYRADQDINKLVKFWSKKTSIPTKYFYHTKPDPRTIGKRTKNKNYYGVCVITCAGTKKQLELQLLAEMISGL